MTPNARAKIFASLILSVPLPASALVLIAIGPPFPEGFFVACAAFTTVLALALAGARDFDGIRRDFHGGAPAYWVPCTVWLLACIFAAAAGWLPMAATLVRWVVFSAGALHALADFGCRVKNR
jgi:hypothetical protein